MTTISVSQDIFHPHILVFIGNTGGNTGSRPREAGYTEIFQLIYDV